METSAIPHQSNPHQVFTPPSALQHLKVFIGQWQINGQNLDGAPLGADLPVTGEQSYEWFPGHFFMISRWERQFGDGQYTGLGIISYDPATHFFSASNYDNLGYARTYKLYQEHGAWKYVGEQERATLEFSPDGNTYNEYWEIAEEGGNWMPLCRLEGRKIK